MALTLSRRSIGDKADIAVTATVLAGCLLVPLFFTIAVDDAFALPKTTLVRVLVTCGIVILGLGFLFNRNRRLPSTGPVDWMIGAFVLFNLLAFVASSDRGQSLNGERFQFQGLSTMLTYVSAFYLARKVIRDEERLSLLFWSVTIGGALVASYALVQKAGLDPIWRDLPSGRVFSSIGQPNALAAYLLLVIPVSGALIARGRPLSRAIAGLIAVIMIGALAFTYSRAGYLALILEVVVTVAFLLVRLRPRRRAVVAVFVAVLVATTMGLASAHLPPNSVWQRASAIGDAGNESTQLHLDLWRTGAEMVRDHPLLGTGQETFPEVFPHYRDTVLSPERAAIDSKYRPESPHNVYLTIAAGSGVPALLSYLSFVCLVSVTFFQVLRGAGGRGRWREVALVALLAATFGHVLTDSFMTAEITGSWLWWLLLGAGLGVLGGELSPETALANWP